MPLLSDVVVVVVLGMGSACPPAALSVSKGEEERLGGMAMAMDAA